MTTWQRGMLRTAAATAAYGVVHSLLADSATKRAVAWWIGEKPYRGLYRAFYQGQSVATLVVLVAYIRRLPDHEVYEVKGPAALGLRVGQAGALVTAAWTIAAMGPGRFTGISNLVALAVDPAEVPEAPEGHGPSPDPDGSIHPTGPFRHTRHPVHLAFPLLTWLQPRMTTNLLAYNLVATAYFILGAAREEARLRETYGSAYRDYQESGVPFYIPSPTPEVSP